MGKAKRFSAYDSIVAEARKATQSYGQARQDKAFSGSSFRNAPPTPTFNPSTLKIRGNPTGEYLSVSLSSAQTTNLAANEHIEFDQIDEDGGIELQTGVGQADGIFELLSGNKYLLSAQLRPEFSGATGELIVAWYDRTNSTQIGRRAIYQSQTHASDNANQPVASIIVTPDTNIDVEVRIIGVTALTLLTFNYTIANIFEISLGGSGTGGGGGGGDDNLGNHIATQELDINTNDVLFDEIATPGNPSANKGKLYTKDVAAVTKLFFLDSAGNDTDLLAGGSSQTPWLQDIDADGFDLKDLSNIEFRTPTTGSPAGSVPSLWIDASGDMVQNVATGDQFFLTVDGITALQVKDGETEVRSTFGSATTGPQLSIFNNDSGIVINDRVGLVSFRALNSTPSETQFGSIEVEADVLTAGAEEATMNFVCVGASGTPQLTLQASSTGNGNFVGVAAGADKIIPSSDGGKECGDATHHWDDVFSETFTLRGSGGNTTGSVRTIYADVDDMIFNMPTGDGFTWKRNNVKVMRLHETTNRLKISLASGIAASLHLGDVSTDQLRISYEDTNSTGSIVTSKQLSIRASGTGGLRLQTLSTDKLGFFGAAPVVQSAAYSVTNLTTDRSYDADSTSLAEVSDVLGTLLSDLVKLGIIG